ncbi:MAG: sulfite exporter TauE/SafE family protein [Acidimicrobiia bacterium]|nr:sulfite exporter TauE/SafE family protein [Acidimicrobiia bacterium]MBT8216595.1 sulfite exporter TauE/SafE family protein [Acidimicrobiia bacterium]NNF09860.1 sulfite exporter TauE/SafE family protein [Acidimicrobiia bacterium]NNL70839.1 sulfite exporter TauE/SafE family protein [Acidimicrobiia bacterium]
MPVDPWILLIAFAITVAAGLVQGTIGFGLAVVSVPLLSLLDRDLAPVPQLLIALPLAVAMVWREWRHLDLSGVGWVLTGRLPGALLGVFLLKVVSETALDVLIGGLVLVGVAIVASGVVIRLSPVTKFAAGVASGTMGLVASIGGPPLALLYRDVAGGRLRSSLNAIFAIGIIVSITIRVLAGEITGDDIRVGVVLLPAAFVGLWLSRFFTDQIEGAALKNAVLAVSALAAAGLLVRSVLG